MLGVVAIGLFVATPFARRGVRRVVAALGVTIALVHGWVAIDDVGLSLESLRVELARPSSRHGALAWVLAATLFVARRASLVERRLLVVVLLVLVALHVLG